jgi:hypothetical protein
MSSSGWKRPLCSYFYSVCLKVLSSYFSAYGFAAEKNKIGGVIFKKNGIFVEVSYDPESSPNYFVSMVVGIGEGAYDEFGRFTGVPIWSVVPEGSPESNFLARTFSDENELSGMLSEAESVILEKYVKPLWQYRSALEEAERKFTSV